MAPAFAPFLLPCRTWRVRCWAALRGPVPSSQAFRTEEWMLCSYFLLTRGEKFTGGTFFLKDQNLNGDMRVFLQVLLRRDVTFLEASCQCAVC